MSEVGIRALKQNASAVVAAVVAGDEVTITDRGRAVAQLVAIPAGRLGQLQASGRLRLPKRALVALPEPAPRRRGRPSLSDVLAAQRDAERH